MKVENGRWSCEHFCQENFLLALSKDYCRITRLSGRGGGGGMFGCEFVSRLTVLLLTVLLLTLNLDTILLLGKGRGGGEDMVTICSHITIRPLIAITFDKNSYWLHANVYCSTS